MRLTTLPALLTLATGCVGPTTDDLVPIVMTDSDDTRWQVEVDSWVSVRVDPGLGYRYFSFHAASSPDPQVGNQPLFEDAPLCIWGPDLGFWIGSGLDLGSELPFTVGDFQAVAAPNDTYLYSNTSSDVLPETAFDQAGQELSVLGHALETHSQAQVIGVKGSHRRNVAEITWDTDDHRPEGTIIILSFDKEEYGQFFDCFVPDTGSVYIDTSELAGPPGWGFVYASDIRIEEHPDLGTTIVESFGSTSYLYLQ